MIQPWQQTAFQSLVQAFHQNRLSHAYLLSGIAGLGKTQFAKMFAQFLLCQRSSEVSTQAVNPISCSCQSCKKFLAGTHPDFLLISPHEKTHAIKIEQIRALSQQISRTAHAGGYQVVVISPADAMPVAAANALLKTLEEPSGNVVIFLIDDQTHPLLPTIAS